LVLPPHDAKEPSFVEFSPSDVILSRQDVTGLSARNHLRGQVRRIVPVGQAVFVAVDVGQILWAEVTPQSVTELDLTPGCEVVCLLKTHSLRVVAKT
jgi:molybdopterin-binding protein